jgi:outer membrane protein OmpA-like peptidoglycan-associated protein
MRRRSVGLLVLLALGGCSLFGGTGKYSVYFQPYSAVLDETADHTIKDATSYAQSHPLMPVKVTGYSAPPDPGKDVDGLSDDRADAVKKALIAGGITPNRIITVGNGITDPQLMPTVAVRRVDIAVGP